MKPAASLRPQGLAESGRRDGQRDLGDRLACGLLLAAFIAAVLLGAWFIADMPSLR